jgi:hypothetical protein
VSAAPELIETELIETELIETASLLRSTGDVLADELSVMNHTTGISGRARDALTDWDALSFKLRRMLKELGA